MKKVFALVVVILGSNSGCALMEDLMFGDDSYSPPVTVSSQPASCNVVPTTVNSAQTSEPEISRR